MLIYLSPRIAHSGFAESGVPSADSFFDGFFQKVHLYFLDQFAVLFDLEGGVPGSVVVTNQFDAVASRREFFGIADRSAFAHTVATHLVGDTLAKVVHALQLDNGPAAVETEGGGYCCHEKKDDNKFLRHDL